MEIQDIQLLAGFHHVLQVSDDRVNCHVYPLSTNIESRLGIGIIGLPMLCVIHSTAPVYQQKMESLSLHPSTPE
jgi:hypothetical protein